MQTPPRLPTNNTSDPDNLRVIKHLGKGATGTVLLVHDSVDDPSALDPFALKVLADPSSAARDRLLHEASVLSLLTEHPHPFLPVLLGGQNNVIIRDDILAFAMPYCHGGDLHLLRHRLPDRVFSTSALRFYLSELVSALRHLHWLGIAFRDLKPENILIQWSGHLTLADFDLSKRLPPPSTTSPPQQRLNLKHKRPPARSSTARVSPVGRRRRSLAVKSYSFVGTEEYVAPEVIRGDGHGFSVDWWALGVLAYELSFGKTPFKGKNKTETFRNVVTKPVLFPGQRTSLTDLIERLLAKDPVERLGYFRGAEEVMEHEFFRGVRWDLLSEVARPPFIPPWMAAEDATAPRMNLAEYLRKIRKPPPALQGLSSSDGERSPTET